MLMLHSEADDIYIDTDAAVRGIMDCVSMKNITQSRCSIFVIQVSTFTYLHV